MNRVVYPKEKELTVMAQKKKDSKMMGKIIKTAVSGVLCVALAGGMVAANVLIPPNASSVQSILGLKSGGIDNSKAKTEGINMEYSKPGFDTEAALVEDEIALNKKIAAEGIVLLKNKGDRIEAGQPVARLYAQSQAQCRQGQERFLEALEVGGQPPEMGPMIVERVEG